MTIIRRREDRNGSVKSLEVSKASDRDVDGGWAWMVLAGSFLCSVIAFGHMFNSAIYFVTFTEAFGQPRAHIAWIITAQGIALHTAGPLTSLVLAKCGPRVTMICGGMLSGLAMMLAYFAGSVAIMIPIFALNGTGIAFMLTSSLSSMPFYFQKYFNVATGVTNSGAGIGVIVMGFQLEWAIDSFGWRGAMLIQSGVMLQAVLCGSLLFNVPMPSPANSGVPKLPVKAALDRSVFRDVRLQLLFASFFLFYFYFNIFVLIMKDDFLQQGFEMPYEAAIMGLGVSNTLGRLTAGFFSEFMLVPPLQLFVACTLASVGCAAVTFVCDEWAYLLCFVLVGFANGQQVVLQNLTLAYVFGRPHMQVLWGCGLFMGAFAYISGSPAAGYIKDLTGSNNSAFLMSSLSSFMCGLMCLVCYLIHRKRLATNESAPSERVPLKLPSPIIEKPREVSIVDTTGGGA